MQTGRAKVPEIQAPKKRVVDYGEYFVTPEFEKDESYKEILTECPIFHARIYI